MYIHIWTSSGASDGKECMQCRTPRFDPRIGKIRWRRKWLPTPVFLPGEFMDRGAWWAMYLERERKRNRECVCMYVINEDEIVILISRDSKI